MWHDLNSIGAQDNTKWYKARQYYWLQEDKNVKEKLIKKLEDGYATSFIFDEDKIIDFFNDHPEMLPEDKSKVKEFYYDRDK